MKGKRLFVLACCGVLLAACASVDDPEAVASPVGFAPPMSEVQTRYTQDALPPAMGVFAYLTDGSFTTAATPNFMYNQPVTRNGDTWSCTPLKYWPTATNDRLSFFAYTPYADEKTTGGSNPAFSGNTAQGYPVLTYTVAAEADKQTDLLAAKPLMDCSKQEVKFTMRHALTKVILRVKSGDKYAKEITVLSIHASNKGELHFNNDGFEWKNITTGGEDYIPAAGTDLNFAVAGTERDVVTFYMLSTGTVDATYSLTYKVKKEDGTEVLTKSVTDVKLPSTPLWKTGATVVYTFSLYEQTATVSTETINEWTAGAAETSYTTFTENDLKVGDYYYSDGTTSDGGLRKASVGKDANTGGQTGSILVKDKYDYETKSPDKNKTCVGIVFYVGQGEGDDVANYSSFGMNRIDGYVVALTDCGDKDKTNWGPTGDIEGIYNANPTTDLNFNGFVNTETVKKLSNYSSYTAFYKAVNYSGTRPTTKASTWYLPSVTQLRWVYSSHYSKNHPPLKILGQNIEKAKGTGLFASRYWSSTPYSSTCANYVGFDGGDMNTDQSKTEIRWQARAILTFQTKDN
ncbi:MAG: fimbrillin family protein [Bacteroides sp.]|nr:fimbrillin family protein [Bacteroides sp.]